MADNLLITGYWGEPHVTAENDRGFNAAVFGPGRFVMPVGEQLRAEYIGNNTVRVYDGKLMTGGAMGGVPAGKYIDLLIPETGQGMKRNDLIVFQYSKDISTLIETGSIIVVSGAETSGTPADPVLEQQDLLTDEATFDQMPLYRITVSGASISAPVRMFSIISNFQGMKAGLGAVNLLDNSNFTEPVNTLGKSSYRGLGFSIDRWVVPNDSSALTVGDGFVLIQNDHTSAATNFTNRLRVGTIKNGRTYTGVICLVDGTIISGSGVCVAGGVAITDPTRYVSMKISTGTPYDSAMLAVNPGKYARIKYAALYEGEYGPNSLPVYVPRGYEVEMLISYIMERGSLFTELAPASVV
jgi:hypothetical protein